MGGGSGGAGGVVVDNGLPDPALPTQWDCANDPTDPTCQYAVIAGFPNGSCPQTDLSNSLPVGATLGSVNKDGVVTARSVVDINQVNAAGSTQIINNQTVVSTWVSVGWLYLDNNGGLWFQKDPAAQWTFTMNVNINQYFGLSFTPPAAQNPQYIKNRPTTTPIANNLQTTKCFRRGRALVPGALSGPSGPPVT
jgi:hypothetical protein